MVVSACGPIIAIFFTSRPSGRRFFSFLSSVTDSSARRRESSLPLLATVLIAIGSSRTYGLSNKPRANLSRSTRRTDSSSWDSGTLPLFTADSPGGVARRPFREECLEAGDAVPLAVGRREQVGDRPLDPHAHEVPVRVEEPGHEGLAAEVDHLGGVVLELEHVVFLADGDDLAALDRDGLGGRVL